MRHGSACRALLTAVAALLAAMTAAPPARAVTPPPVRLLIDTDLFSDADDVGALAAAFALQHRHAAKVLGIGLDTRLDRPKIADDSPGCAAAVAQFYGYPHVPIGAARPLHGTEQNTVDFIGPCAALAAPTTPIPRPVLRMYRNILSRQPPNSVVMVSLGYLSNFAALLDSPADAISPLTGSQLVAAKVNRLVVMGGGYPSRSGENNFEGNPGAAADVATNWPGPIIWDGHEVGDAVHTGQTISSTHPENSPVRDAYEAFVGPGNWIFSYDLTAVFYAVRSGNTVLTTSVPGDNHVAADGSNQFVSMPGADQRYLKLHDADRLAGLIEGLLDVVP